jgi:hypothetical protein
VVSKDYYQRGVDVLSKENNHHCEKVALSGILWLVYILSNDIEEDM